MSILAERRSPNILITETFTGSIPAAQTRVAVDADIKSARRSGNKRVIRTLKALGVCPSDWKNPSIGLITNALGDRHIIIVAEPESTVEE